MPSVGQDSEIQAVAEEWEALAERTDAAPFLRPGWVAAWWEAFGTRGALEVITRRNQAGELVAVLPMVWMGRTVRSLTNAHSPVFGAVADDGERPALYESLLARRPRRLEIGMLAAESADPASIDRVAGDYAIDRRTVARSPYVSTEGDWGAYWDSLSSKLRSSVRRCTRRLGELGEVELDIRTGGDDLDRLLDEAFALEASGWKGDAGTAIISSPETDRFYRSVAAWAAEGGLLSLAFLRVDGRAVAVHFGLETASAYYLVKVGHDATLNKAGPGLVLAAQLIERAFDQGFRSFEFLGQDDPHKLRWGATVRERILVRAFAPTLAGRADRIVQVDGRAAGRSARRLVRSLTARRRD